jgi:hypothetical protein
MVLGGASLILANGTFGLMKWWFSVKVGDLVSKNIKFTNQTLYGVIIKIDASSLYVKVHWLGDYGTFWTNIWDMEVIT